MRPERMHQGKVVSDMQENEFVNQITVTGEVLDVPLFSHKAGNCDMFKFRISTKRLSGTPDVLDVVLDSRILDKDLLRSGNRVEVSGRISTHSIPAGKKSHVVITVLAKTIKPAESPMDGNKAVLRGTICKKKAIRTTPVSNQAIIDFILAVNTARKPAYVPAVAWGAVARTIDSMETGTDVDINGRLQSREYQKTLPDGTVETRTAYELSTWNLSEYIPGQSPDVPSGT